MSLELRWGRFEARLRFRFKHASFDRGAAESIIVEAKQDGVCGYGEGCPRSYVTGETQETALAFLAAHAGPFAAAVGDVESLQAWIQAHKADIDRSPAAFAALELAALDCFGRRDGQPIEALLGVQAGGGPFVYSAVMGDAGSKASAALAGLYRAWGMHDLKLKLSGRMERDRARIRAARRMAGPRARLRADANNAWSAAADCITALCALGDPFWAIEEPLAPGDITGMREVAAALDARIILDESLLRREDLDALADDALTWIANIRVSKAGGLLRTLALVRAAQARGLGVILGAHVGETSLLTRAALAAACVAGSGLIAQEGAYGDLLLASDLTSPSLRFGYGGRLDLRRSRLLRRPGLGLKVDPARVQWA
jgi:L-alanine-DL-glutamate epimerase-like enolase superfamily enzyme